MPKVNPANIINHSLTKELWPYNGVKVYSCTNSAEQLDINRQSKNLWTLNPS